MTQLAHTTVGLITTNRSFSVKTIGMAVLTFIAMC